MGSRKKRGNCEKAPGILENHGLSFKVKCNGLHLMVDTRHGLAHYWPSNEKWRPDGESVRQGLEAFLAFATGEKRAIPTPEPIGKPKAAESHNYEPGIAITGERFAEPGYQGDRPPWEFAEWSDDPFNTSN